MNFAKQIDNKPNKQGYYVIYLRVTKDRKRKFVKSSVSLKKKSDWNSQKQVVRTCNPDHKRLNDILDKELEKLKESYRELAADGVVSLDKVVACIADREVANNNSFLEYVKSRVQEIYDAGQFRNYKKYNGFYNKLVAFQSRNGKLVDVTFNEITASYLSKFEHFLRTLRNEREKNKLLHVNTIEVVMKIFKSLIKRAIEIDKLMDFSDNPFLTYKFHGVKVNKQKLDAVEIESIKNLDLKEATPTRLARDCFMFSYYCAGIRAADLITLRWCNISSDGRLNYEMGKNHKLRDLLLVPQAKEILSHYKSKDKEPTDYIFPLLNGNETWCTAITQAEKDVLPLEQKVSMYKKISAKNSFLNKYLKIIAKMAGITKTVSMHIARHSFARTAKEKGVDNSHVQSLLAHSSIKITESYMGNFDTGETDKALLSIFQQPMTEEEKDQHLLEQLKMLPPERLSKILIKLHSNK